MDTAPDTQRTNIQEIVGFILRDAPFWAPEERVHKLVEYLNAYKQPLFDALKALPRDQQKDIGLDQVRVGKPS